MSEVKEYLMQVFNIDRDINSRLREQETIRQTLVRASSIKSDKVQESGSGMYDDKYMPLFDIHEQIGKKIDEAVELRIEVSERIDRVEDAIYRSVLRDRYLNCMKWEEMAEVLNCSQRTILYQHGNALKAFEEVNQDLFCSTLQ